MSDGAAVAAGAGSGAGSRFGLAMPAIGQISALGKRSDLLLAVGVMTILVVLIFPLPAVLLDLLLAVSIITSVLILMTALFIEDPLEFTVFPTILLIATILRLALNLASTRLILAHGHEGTAAAGHVIEAFGNLVMAGNFVIGAIVFAILIIVNFVVITKGSGRIAEVAARFSLDAMPGKQMAIDADLSAGLIDEKEAKKRRKDLEDESSPDGLKNARWRNALSVERYQRPSSAPLSALSRAARSASASANTRSSCACPLATNRAPCAGGQDREMFELLAQHSCTRHFRWHDQATVTGNHEDILDQRDLADAPATFAQNWRAIARDDHDWSCCYR